jgi:Ca-activated chloride channel homolog
MTFLAGSLTQVVILTLLTAGLIVVFYLIKLRRRKVFVPSSMVWRKVLDQTLTRKLENVRTLISVVLTTIIGVLLILAIMRPQIEALTGKDERIVIVLDSSPTMNALMGDGRSRWQHAVEESESLLNTGGPTTEFRLVDTAGTADSLFTTNRDDVRSLLNTLRPRASDLRFPGVDSTNAQTYFITDGVSPVTTPENVQRIAVFEPAENVGITAFEIRPLPINPQGFEAYLQVENRGSLAAAVDVTLTGAGQQKITRNSRLAPGQTLQEVFDLTAFQGGGIRANVISKGDEFALDDEAFAYLPVKRKTRTLLVTSGNPYLEAVLKSDTAVELTLNKPAEYRESPNYDAYIFDRFAPPQAPGRPALVLGVPSAPWLREVRGSVEKPVITTWRDDHPIMQFVAMHDVSIEKASQIDAENLTVIASSADAPLIVASSKPKWVMLTFDLGSSDLAFQAGFPVFVNNVLAWFSRDGIALPRKPGLVSVPFSNAQITTIDGKPVPSRQVLNETVFEAADPGLYIAAQDDTRVHVAVNLSNPDFSDVNRSALKDQSTAAGSGPPLRHELWFYMVFVAFALIAAEWFTYHRRITL